MTKDLQVFLRILRYVKPYVIMFSVGLVLHASQSFIFPLIMGFFMGGVTDGILVYDMSMVFGTLIQVIGMMLVFMFAVGLGVYISSMAIAYAMRDLQLVLFSAYVKSSAESQKHSGEGIAAVTTDTGRVEGAFDRLRNISMNIFGGVVSIIAIAIIDWRMGIGAFLVGIVAFIAQSGFIKPLGKINKKWMEANTESIKALSNIFSGALTIRAFSMQRHALVEFDRETGKMKKLLLKEGFIQMWRNLFTTVQGWVTLVVVFALGGWLVSNNYMTMGQIMAVLPLAEAAGSNMSEVGNSFASLQVPLVAAKRVFAIIDDAPAQTQEEAVSWNGDSTIFVQNLSFSYKDANKNALEDISLTIGKNQMVAFVGESGSGKSTLLRLLMCM